MEISPYPWISKKKEAKISAYLFINVKGERKFPHTFEYKKKEEKISAFLLN